MPGCASVRSTVDDANMVHAVETAKQRDRGAGGANAHP
jgi:hypothetical protein